MSSSIRRGLITAAALAVTGALAGTGLTGTAAAAAPRNDPVITVRVGGDRAALTGPGTVPNPNVTGLGGVEFEATGPGGFTTTCVSDPLGDCLLSVPDNETYTITQIGTPPGYYNSENLGAGRVSPAPVTVTEHRYNSLTVTVGTTPVTVPAVAGNGIGDTAPTLRSGAWALSRDDPGLPSQCGLRIAVLFDLSSSITGAILPTYQAAGRALVNALHNTPSPSYISLYTFGTTAPAPSTPPGSGNNDNLTPPVETNNAGVTALDDKIDGFTVPPASYTNWDAGIFQIAADNALYHYQAAIVLTDGDPTRWGPDGDLGGVPAPGPVTARFAETEYGIFSANTLKADGVPVIGVGIGTNPEGLEYLDNLRAISGPTENVNYYNTDFAHLGQELTSIALRNCAGIDVTKAASPRTFHYVGQPITFHYTVTNTHPFTLHDVHVTDDHIPAPIPCTPAVLTEGQVAHCSATYHITQADLDRGYVTNTARSHGTTPNDDPVTSDEVHDTITAIRRPHLSIEKYATPPDFTTPGQVITYHYRVTNTGNVTQRNITVADDKIHGPATCPATTLAPGHYMICHATYTITAADVERGYVDNIATVTGDPPAGPPETAETEAVIEVGVPVTG